jgi:hypothetical protein
VTPRVFLRGGGGKGSLDVLDAADPSARVLAHWEWSDALRASSGDACPELPSQNIVLGARDGAPTSPSRAKLEKAWLRVRADGAAVALDRTLVKKASPAAP